MSTFGEKVRKRREEMNLNQDQLASLAGINRRSIVNYETDAKKPFFSTLRKLAAALGVTIYYLQNDDVEDPQANIDEEPYIQAARDAYGKKAQDEMASILTQTEALFAGGSITEDQKDVLYQALSQAYFRNKERARKKFGRKEPKIFEPYTTTGNDTVDGSGTATGNSITAGNGVSAGNDTSTDNGSGNGAENNPDGADSVDIR